MAKRRRDLDDWESILDLTPATGREQEAQQGAAPTRRGGTRRPLNREERFWEDLFEAEFGEDAKKPLETLASVSQEVREEAQEAEPFTVSGLIEALNPFLEDRFGRVRVRGEISNFAAPRSGHYYFHLKDAQGVVAAVMFRAMQDMLFFQPFDGMEVVCTGVFSMYARRGKVQLSVTSMELVGEGELALAFARCKERLEQEGLFAEERKRPLPRFPRRIGLVTSPTGAALQDILEVLGRRSPTCSLVLASCQVQGPGAAAQIKHAIEGLNRLEGIDLLIVGRGGGALEDLWAFNEEIVARAVAASRIPVLTGVGHETDTTIVDYVADKRAPTPSAAAELAVPNEEEIRAQFASLQHRLATAMQAKLQRLRLENLSNRRRLRPPLLQIQRQRRRLEQLQHRLEQATERRSKRQERRLFLLQQRLLRQEPQARIKRMRQHLAQQFQRLQFAMERLLRERKHRLQRMMGQLDALSPLQVLARGYALVVDEQGALVREKTQLAPGQKVRLRLHDTEVWARIEDEEAPSETNAATKTEKPAASS